MTDYTKIDFYMIDQTGERFHTAGECEGRAAALVAAGRDYLDLLRWEHCPGAGWEWAPWKRLDREVLREQMELVEGIMAEIIAEENQEKQ